MSPCARISHAASEGTSALLFSGTANFATEAGPPGILGPRSSDPYGSRDVVTERAAPSPCYTRMRGNTLIANNSACLHELRVKVTRTCGGLARPSALNAPRRVHTAAFHTRAGVCTKRPGAAQRRGTPRYANVADAFVSDQRAGALRRTRAPLRPPVVCVCVCRLEFPTGPARLLEGQGLAEGPARLPSRAPATADLLLAFHVHICSCGLMDKAPPS